MMDDKQLNEALTYNPRLVTQGEKRRQRNEEARDPSEMAGIIAGFHPVLGPIMSAKDFKESYEKDEKVGMGLAALGMLPVVGGAVKPITKALSKPNYDVFNNLTDIKNMFRTERGSTYAHHADATTTRNRSGVNHKDASEGLQARSGKTVFLDPKDVNNVGGYFQNPDMATKVVPIFDEAGKPTGKLAVQLAEDYGPRKAGETLYETMYKTKPEVGLSPVEIYNSQSLIGDVGSGIHFGNRITEVIPKLARGGAIKMPENYSKGNWKLI
jgi:hypothetical protein